MVIKRNEPCYVLGVGMTKFIKPRGKVDYTELGFEAGIKALLDAQITYDDVDQGVAATRATPGTKPEPLRRRLASCLPPISV